MKKTELRIGNWIADRGLKEWQIDHWETMNKVASKSNATMCNGILMETHPLTEYIDYLKPIPLTEEWLERLWFERDGDWVKIQFEPMMGIQFYNGNSAECDITQRGQTISFKCNYIKYVQ